MRNCDTDFLNALNAMDTPEQPLTPGELDRLAAGVFARIDTACAPIRRPGCPASAPPPGPPPCSCLCGSGCRCLRRQRHCGGGGAGPGGDAFRRDRLFSPARRNKARWETPWTRPAAVMTAMPQA